MISAAFPGFLIAAGIFAAVPVALHFLARRPPARAPLPTARFLREDPRTLLRLQRKPTDVWLLAVRLAFALALAGAFAGLSWMPDRSGAARVVLVDAGADPAVDWADAVEAVRRSGVGDGAADGPVAGEASVIVLAYGLDDGARAVALDEVAALERGSGPATAEDGLRALRDLARTARFAEAEVVWVGRPTWRTWSAGLGLMRSELWPGRVEVRSIAAAAIGDVSGETRSDGAGDVSAETRSDGADVSGETPANETESDDGSGTPVVWLVSGSAEGPLARAVEALGGRLTDPAESEPSWIFAPDASGALEPLLARARGGATLVLSGALAEPGDAVPWADGEPAAGSTPPAPAQLLLSGDRAVGAPVDRLPGTPAAGARTVAIFDDGAPAAAARPLADGCVVYLAASLTAPALTSSAAYPELIRMLAHGCDDLAGLDAPLDRGALQVLERPDLPGMVDVASLVAAEGVPLTRWLLFLALALLGLEVAMTRERRA